MSLSRDYFIRPLKIEADKDPLFARIRDLVREKGVDPDTAIIADFFPDDTSFYFGLLVTPAGRVFEFGYDYLRVPEVEGRLSEWNDLTETWRTSPYDEQVGEALEMVGAAT